MRSSLLILLVYIFLLNLITEIYASTFSTILNSFPSKNIPIKNYHRKPTDPKVPSNPIILVPGDGGSQLEANLTGKPYVVHYTCSKTTKDFFDLWLNLETFIPVAIECWTDNMKLIFNETTKSSDPALGVDIRVPGFGGTESVEWLDPSRASQGNYFAYIVNTFVSWGYKRGKNLVGAPYDWRKSPLELLDYYANLKSLIQRVYYYNHEMPVIVLAHSMGNPIMNYFYHQYVNAEWKAKFIKSHISLAGAWGGSTQIVKLFAFGYNMDYYRVILPPSALRDMQRSFTSSAFLFPSSKIWAKNEFLAFTAEKNYSAHNVKEFFEDIKYPIGWEQYKLANSALILDSPGVETHCIFGEKIKTPEFFTWAKGYFPGYQPTITFGDGDGTVNMRSLKVCESWKGNNYGFNVSSHQLDGADHMSILRDPRTIDLLRNILYGK